MPLATNKSRMCPPVLARRCCQYGFASDLHVERVPSTNTVKSNGSVTTTQPIVRLTKYPGRRHTILDTNSIIAHDANNHAMNITCMCNPKCSSNCTQVSGNANGKHPATTQTQINHNISETAHTTRPRKRCRKRTDTANAGTLRACKFCVPSAGTAKINCRFEQQTVTREETHARNAGKTQKTGTHDTVDSRAPNSVTLACTLQQGAHRTEGSARGVHERRCSMQTYNSHVFGSDALLSNNTNTETEKDSNNTQHHEYHLVAVRTSHSRHCWRISATVSHVGPSDEKLRPEFGRI